jgi:hypothetical protein
MKFLRGHARSSTYLICCRLITLVQHTYCAIFNIKCFNVVRFEILTALLMNIEVFLDVNSV